MILLISGLFAFLGIHSVRLVAPGWREAQIARVGLMPWKGWFALSSLLAFALLVYGYGEARATAPMLWTPPLWTHHVTALLMIVAFLCIAAAYIPGNIIKAKFGHPMLAGVKTWSFAHLLANGTLADVLLFGAFLIWSVLEFRAFRRRDRAAGVTYAHVSPLRDVAVLIAGLVGYVVFAVYLHSLLIGVRPY